MNCRVHFVRDVGERENFEMSKPQFAPPREGSRKRRVFDLWQKAPDQAFTLGKKLKLQETTLHSWFGHWRRMCVAKVKKGTAKKSAPKAKATKQTEPAQMAAA